MLVSEFFAEQTEKFNLYLEIYKNKYNLAEEDFAVLSVIQDLINLYEIYGDVSSVVSYQNDPEVQSLKNLYDVYAGVKLKEHVRNVWDIALEEFEKEKKVMLSDESLMSEDFRVFIDYTLMALGHDVGKIPELREGEDYAKGDHAYYSFLFLSEKLKDEGLDTEKFKHVLKAIRDHHYPVKDKWTLLLKKFDQKARERESVNVSIPAGVSTEEDIPWLEDVIKEALSVLEKYINKELEEKYKGKVRYVAFSQPDGTIYVYPDFFRDLVIDIAVKKGYVKPFWFFDENEKLKSMIAINNILRKLDASLVPENRGGIHKVIEINRELKVKAYLLALRSSVFGKPVSEFEKVRKSHEVLRKFRIKDEEIVGKKEASIPS